MTDIKKTGTIHTEYAKSITTVCDRMIIALNVKRLIDAVIVNGIKKSLGQVE